ILQISSIDDVQMQSILDKIVKLICDKNNLSLSENETVAYELINGRRFSLPKLFYEINGHKLEKYIVNTFPRMRQYGKDMISIKRSIVEKGIRLFPEYLPRDLLETFLKLQNAPIS